MRKRLLAAAALALSVALATVASATARPTPAELAQQAHARAVLSEITNLDAQMEHVVNAWDEANIKLASLNRQIKQNRTALRRARVQLRIARTHLARRLVAVYENGEPTLIDVLVSATSLSQLIDRIQTAQYVVQEDQRIATAMHRAARTFARRQRSLARAESQQRRTVDQLASARATIEQTLARRRSLLASIRTQIARLQAQERAQERYLAAVARARIAREEQQLAAARARATRAHAASAPSGAPAPAAPAPSSAPATRAPIPAAPAPSAAPAPVASAGGGHPEAAAIAARYLGIPYRWGGASPATGFDCSGLVTYVYAQLGISLPHYTVSQWNAGIPISRSQLEPGDLVFFDQLGHVGIYIGGNQFIHAPHTGDVVRVGSLSEGWFAANYDGARRIP